MNHDDACTIYAPLASAWPHMAATQLQCHGCSELPCVQEVELSAAQHAPVSGWPEHMHTMHVGAQRCICKIA